MEDWTEKYRPKSLRNVIGNVRALSSLRGWAERWNQGKTPEKRAAILSGKPGTGKTSTAHALAADLGWTVLELNASDARNESSIRKVATARAVNETFDVTGDFTPSRRGGHKHERVEQQCVSCGFNGEATMSVVSDFHKGNQVVVPDG